MSKKNGGKEPADLTTKLAEVRKLQTSEANARVKLCKEEVFAVLKKHHCAMRAEPLLSPIGQGGFVLGANVIFEAKLKE